MDLTYPYHDLTHAIIGASFRVHRTWGFGFLESVYRRALVVELEHAGIESKCEVPFELHHRGVPIGLYRADLIVADKVIVEVKSGVLLDPASVPQTLNYLRASGLLVGLITYFGPRFRVKRLTDFDGAERSLRKPVVTDCTDDTDDKE